MIDMAQEWPSVLHSTNITSALLVMCSCSRKRQVSIASNVFNRETESEAKVADKCNGTTTQPLHLLHIMFS